MRNPVRVLACIAALATAAAGTPASAAPPGGPSSTAKQAATTGAAWVTLVTGDRVAVAAGRPRQIDPAKRSGPARFAQFAVRGDWYVVPSDAFRLVNAGVLDRQLFNVTGLVRQGYDDAHTKVVPLLAEYPNARAAAAPAGARKGRVIAGANLAVLQEQKEDAPQFWASITRGGATKLSAGPRKLWLNGKVRANLDKSVPQVGAPAAWQAGYTGKGVTVAVLDTGYDTDHADLAGRIGATKDFSGTGSVEDKFGHGTHVASIALGSGAASKGKYKGVAPDAKLAVGKVLDDGGSGTFDGIIAGMEWAATEAKAKVVNMSLGGWPTDGTDPMSQAVNRISRQHGTLFVIAAGNFGSDGAISTPAAADDALTVGSVTKSDELSEFSSRGPRLGDNAIKPDIAAPGSDIVAARATGTFPDEAVDENYAKLSGTSMATPHVAGAAAILAQKYPTWTGEALKAALMGTAKPLGKLGPNAVGAGRLDLQRATSQQVTATPGSASTYLKWPHATTPAQRRTVKYRNTSPVAVSLTLKLALTNEAGRPAPAGLAKLSATTVTVPANGEASVDVTIKPVAGKVGNYVGVLGAATADGRTAVRTPFGVYEEPERYDLSFTVKDRNGAPADAASHYVAAVNLDTGDTYFGAAGERFRVAPGRYLAVGEVATARKGLEPSLSFLSNPEVRITRNTVLPLDARKGKKITMGVDQPAANGGFRLVSHTAKVKAYDYPFGVFSLADPRFHEFYAASTPGVRSAGYRFGNWLHAETPAVSLAALTPEKFQIAAGWLDLPTPEINAQVGSVYGGAGTPEELAKVDPKGKLVTLALPASFSWEQVVERLGNVKAAGGRLALAVPIFENGTAAGFHQSAEEPEGLPLPTLVGSGVTTMRFLDLTRKGTVTAQLKTVTSSPHRYEVVVNEKGAIPAVLNYSRKTKDLAAVRTRYYGHPGADFTRYVYSTVQLGGDEINPFLEVPASGPGERVEYFTPGLWTHAASSSDLFFDQLQAAPTQLRVGAGQTLAWNKAAFGPTFAGSVEDELGKHPWAHRTGSLIDVTAPLFGDAAGHARRPFNEEGGDTGTTKLYRNGKLLGTMNMAGRGLFPVTFEESTYRLTTEATRNMPEWRLATKVTGAWTFKSAGWVPGALPLLTVGFDPAVDLRNTTAGGKAFSFPAVVTRQAGSGTAEVTSLTVKVSYDDGKTWKPATVVRDGAKWKVTVTHPKSGFVSLRAAAADAQGNTVEQTVIRAYELR